MSTQTDIFLEKWNLGKFSFFLFLFFYSIILFSYILFLVLLFMRDSWKVRIRDLSRPARVQAWLEFIIGRILSKKRP